MGSLLAAPRVPSFVLSNPSTSTEQAIAGTAGQGNNSTTGSSATEQTLSANTNNTVSSEGTDSSGTDTTQNTSESNATSSNLLLRQNRGTNSTILTSLRGLLDETETLGAKKTLLGQ